MAYFSSNKNDLVNIGKETFDVIDDVYSRGSNNKYSSSAATVPPSRAPQQAFNYHKYHPQQAYVVQQQVYGAPVTATRTERVINSPKNGTFSSNKNDLVNIGKETFDAIDDVYSRGSNNKYSPSAATVPPSRAPQQAFNYHKYHPQEAYVVQQRGYGAPVTATRTERVIDCNEAAKMYGGTVFVEYPKKKPARNSFFF